MVVKYQAYFGSDLPSVYLANARLNFWTDRPIIAVRYLVPHAVYLNLLKFFPVLPFIVVSKDTFLK